MESGYLLHDAHNGRQIVLNPQQLSETSVIKGVLRSFNFRISHRKQALSNGLIVCAFVDSGRADVLLNPYYKPRASALQENEIAAIYKRNSCTKFFKEDCKIFVKKTGGLHDTSYPWFPGENVDERLEYLAATENWQLFDITLKIFFDYVFNELADTKGGLQPSAVDAIPRNATIAQGECVHLFDLEFNFSGGVTKSFLLFRSAITIFYEHYYILGKRFKNIFTFYNFLCDLVTVTPSLEQDVNDQLSFLAHVGTTSNRKTIFKRLHKPFLLEEQPIKKNFFSQLLWQGFVR